MGAEGKLEELAKQIESSEKTISEIQRRLAYKQYQIGRFYERTKRPSAALFYYNYCLAEYPDTKWAKDCARRAGVLKKRGVVERPGEPKPAEGKPA